MKKLTLFLLILISFNSIAQTISCDDYLGEVEDGYRLDYSWGTGSSAIRVITWYEYDDKLFAVVEFTSSSKGYLYGGWEWSWDSYRKFKDAFDTSESKGGFFNQNIRSAKVYCY